MLEKNDQRMLIIGIAVVGIALAWAFVGGKTGTEGPVAPPPTTKFELLSAEKTISGTGNENTDSAQNVSIDATNIVSVEVTLTWTDEPSSSRHTNQPDALSITVSSPEGEEKSGSDQSSNGNVKVTFSYPVTEKTVAQKTSKKGTGNWDILVAVGNCGDQQPLVPDPLGLRTIADNGNAYSVTITYKYFGNAGPKGVK